MSPNHSGSGDPLDLEYLIAGGDSGGGSFIFENDAWYLAGVHSGTYPSYKQRLPIDAPIAGQRLRHDVLPSTYRRCGVKRCEAARG